MVRACETLFTTKFDITTVWHVQVSHDARWHDTCLRQDDGPMGSPICNKEFVRAGCSEKHLATCRGLQSCGTFGVGGVDLSKPSPRLVPTTSAWIWASIFSVSNVVGRRLPRLLRKIPFALRVEVQRVFSLPLRRLREGSRVVGARMLFLMLPCWCLTASLRGSVAGHRGTRQRIAT